MMFQVLFLSLLHDLVSTAVIKNQYDFCNASFTNRINSVQGLWEARPTGSSDQLSMALGAQIDLEGLERIRLNRSELAYRPLLSLPESFDARIKWPCQSLHEIRNQGRCGSCWAMASASAMTDRQCIHSFGTDQFHYSAEDLICMSGTECEGYSLNSAYQLWETRGVVSSDCMDYSDNHFNGQLGCGDEESDCEPVMINGNWLKDSYKNDRRYAKTVYSLSGEEEIQMELYLNGPLTVSFAVFEDFLCYKQGIYFHTYGNFAGFHGVKLLGWGVTSGQKYWIAANSWGQWGEEGFFRIRRGNNECGTEYFGIAGIPLLKGKY